MQTFKKNERLTGQKKIDSLFSQGKSFLQFPFIVIWIENKILTESPVQVLISVSKKKFKRAVDRNLIKRRIREAYRRNKDALYSFVDAKKISCAVALIYNDDKILSFREIEEKIILLLKRFETEYEKNIK